MTFIEILRESIINADLHTVVSSNKELKNPRVNTTVGEMIELYGGELDEN